MVLLLNIPKGFAWPRSGRRRRPVPLGVPLGVHGLYVQLEVVRAAEHLATDVALGLALVDAHVKGHGYAVRERLVAELARVAAPAVRVQPRADGAGHAAHRVQEEVGGGRVRPGGRP